MFRKLTAAVLGMRLLGNKGHARPRTRKDKYLGGMNDVDDATREQLREVKSFSMLHLDTLLALRYLVRVSKGTILEVGPYVGGSTVAMALPIKERRQKRSFFTIEMGGSVPNHPHIPTNDIVKDLHGNLARYGVQEFVKVLVGCSHDPRILAPVIEAARKNPIGLMVFDSNGNIEGDVACVRPYCRKHCYVVFDDYIETEHNQAKTAQVKESVDSLVNQRQLKPLAVLPWGTWFGMLVP